MVVTQDGLSGTMAALIGLALALAVALFARVVGLDRDRAFYPVVLIVVAAYYVLFAAIGGGKVDIAAQLTYFGLFAAVAVAGFRKSLWFAVAGLAGHGIFDIFHQSFAPGPGVPSWWPPFCLAYDLTAAACLALLLAIEGLQSGKREPAKPGRA